jgi:hypothetical protein
MLLEARAFADPFIPRLKPRQGGPVLDLEPASCVGAEGEVGKRQAGALDVRVPVREMYAEHLPSPEDRESRQDQ